MTATVRFGPRRGAIILDPLDMGLVGIGRRGDTMTAKGVLLTLEGASKNDLVHCILIPLDKLDTVIESMRLVASQIKP